MEARVGALALALALLLTPSAVAEFGPESEDGWPVSQDGVVLRPPVYPVVLESLPGGPLNKIGAFTAYPYYPLLTAEVERLASEHPDLVRLTSAGKSGVGLDMWLLEIADFARIESGEGVPLEEREVVYLDGGTHSNEYSGVYFVTEVAQFLLDEYETNKTARWIVENRHTWILPMVNPDGSHAFGRLNAHGVNVNRNFPATWGAVEEQPVLNNPGPEPASEPETQVVIRLLDELRPDYANSIHCCGNLWLHPWGAEDIPPAEDLQMFTRICDEVFADVRKDCGPIWSTIYPASGTTADEGYARVGASSWTYEMSGRANKVGVWGEPVTELDVRDQERESWNGVMHALLHVEKYGALPKLVSVRGSASELEVVVENAGWGNLTAGNLTVGGRVLPLPFLEPGERATLRTQGAFAAGELPVTLDWQKRVRMAPWEARTLALPLVATPDGRLQAILPDAGEDVLPLSADGQSPVPAPGALPVLAALGVLALALARRRAA